MCVHRDDACLCIECAGSLYEEAARLRKALRHIADGEGGDTQAHDWPEFWESVKRRAREALEGS